MAQSLAALNWEAAALPGSEVELCHDDTVVMPFVEVRRWIDDAKAAEGWPSFCKEQGIVEAPVLWPEKATVEVSLDELLSRITVAKKKPPAAQPEPTTQPEPTRLSRGEPIFMDCRGWLVAGALLAGSAVAAAAYGAHGLKPQVEKGAVEQHRLDDFETADRNQMFHAVGLVLVGLLGLAARTRWPLHVAGAAFLLGIVLFCGSLYVYAIWNNKDLFVVAPAGGISFMVGWLALAVAGWQCRPTKP